MTENLDTVRKIAEQILDISPDPVVRLHLLCNVLYRPLDSSEVIQARKDLSNSRWVQGFAREQLGDGSWGRFHSRDSRSIQKIFTTEYGVQRALALGLDLDHPILARTAAYLVRLLKGNIADFPDRPEKNDRWATGVRLFTSAALSLLVPDDPVLDDVWDLWLTIAQRTFTSGRYDVDMEVQAHHDLTKASVQNSYLAIGGKYQLALLSARPALIPQNLEKPLLEWLWDKKGGIGYLSVILSSYNCNLSSGELDRWFSSLELLSRFNNWRGLAEGAIQWLWRQQTPDGFWNFGPRVSYSFILPMSESLYKRTSRIFDWSTRVLVLLAKFYTPLVSLGSSKGDSLPNHSNIGLPKP